MVVERLYIGLGMITNDYPIGKNDKNGNMNGNEQ